MSASTDATLIDQITVIRERLRAASAAGNPGAHVDQVLEDLDALNDIPFDKDLLAKTKIAPTIGTFRSKFPSSEVKSRAEALFAKFTQAVKAPPPSSPQPPRSVSGEQVETVRKGRRDFIYKKLEETAKQLTSPPSISIQKLAVMIEDSIFKYDDHDTRFRALMESLTNPKTVQGLQFARRLLEGSLAPEKFASLKGEALMSEEQLREIEQRREIAILSNTVPKPLISKSPLFRCRKCRSNNVSYYQQQTRSADEPMTNFCKCGDCAFEWRE
jgi:DNA-directed RNA polymerase subunit M/transcription elongation factor TFIIS